MPEFVFEYKRTITDDKRDDYCTFMQGLRMIYLGVSAVVLECAASIIDLDFVSGHDLSLDYRLLLMQQGQRSSRSPYATCKK